MMKKKPVECRMPSVLSALPPAAAEAEGAFLPEAGTPKGLRIRDAAAKTISAMAAGTMNDQRQLTYPARKPEMAHAPK